MDKNTKYQKAYDEWDKRIGSAKSQARNWRLACFAMLIILIFLVIALFMLMSSYKNYVYIAKVGPNSQIQNVRSLNVPYIPTIAQKEAFVGKFISSIMSLPLDPIVAKTNWLHAYSLSQGKATDQLTKFARAHNPFAELGKTTKTCKILSFHPIGNDSFSFSWKQTIYDVNGKIVGTKLYNGIFTVIVASTPQTTTQILQNPLGLKIVYFSFSNEG